MCAQMTATFTMPLTGEQRNKYDIRLRNKLRKRL